MINVVVADDHALVREGIRRILADANDIRVTGEAADGHEAIEVTRRSCPNVVVMDLVMPNLDGLEATKRLLETSPSSRVVVLSVHSSPAYARRLLDVGAYGYVSKVAAPNELIEAIREAHAGRRYIGRSIALDPAPESTLPNANNSIQSLTRREIQIARLIASGETNTEIARRLDLSAKTVSTHRTNLLAKLHLRNNADLARFAMANNLVDAAQSNN